jgi:hypothetical protein
MRIRKKEKVSLPIQRIPRKGSLLQKLIYLSQNDIRSIKKVDILGCFIFGEIIDFGGATNTNKR